MRTIIRNLDDKFTFGKFSGCTIAEVLKYSHSYIEWFLQNTDGTYCALSPELLPAIRTMFPTVMITKDMEDSMHQMQNRYEDFSIAESYKNKHCGSFETGNLCECGSYERYCGSYAQDEMGYSDDDIDTIFDGDPSAYWNID